jgi:hypothetical protein
VCPCHSDSPALIPLIRAANMSLPRLTTRHPRHCFSYLSELYYTTLPEPFSGHGDFISDNSSTPCLDGCIWIVGSHSCMILNNQAGILCAVSWTKRTRTKRLRSCICVPCSPVLWPGLQGQPSFTFFGSQVSASCCGDSGHAWPAGPTLSAVTFPPGAPQPHPRITLTQPMAAS